MDREIRKLRNFKKWFNKFILKGYGKKCPDFVWGCPVCHAHFVKEIFEDFIDDLIGTENWSNSKKQKKNIKQKKSKSG